MRIISKTHDYYDTVMRHNYHSSDDVYVRNPVEIWEKESLISYFYYYSPALIGFCGKIYPTVDLRFYDYRDHFQTHSVTKTCYNIEECDEIAENFDKVEKERYFGRSKGWNTSHGNRGILKGFFDKFTSPSEAHYSQLFEQHRVPIFTVQQTHGRDGMNTKITLNDNLKQFEFFRIFDPYRAFQEIEMYMSGPLAPAPKIPPVLSDEIMIESHGFNVKTSFRKEKKK